MSQLDFSFAYRSAWYGRVNNEGFKDIEAPILWLHDYDGKKLEFSWTVEGRSATEARKQRAALVNQLVKRPGEKVYVAMARNVGTADETKAKVVSLARFKFEKADLKPTRAGKATYSVRLTKPERVI